jgi:hypothetical protein
MHVCWYRDACMYTCMYICMYVCMHACGGIFKCWYKPVCMYVCMYVCTHVCVCLGSFLCAMCVQYVYMMHQNLSKACMHACTHRRKWSWSTLSKHICVCMLHFWCARGTQEPQSVNSDWHLSKGIPSIAHKFCEKLVPDFCGTCESHHHDDRIVFQERGSLVMLGFRLRETFADDFAMARPGKSSVFSPSEQCGNGVFVKGFSLPSDSEFRIFQAKVFQWCSKFFWRRCHHASYQGRELGFSLGRSESRSHKDSDSCSHCYMVKLPLRFGQQVVLRYSPFASSQLWHLLSNCVQLGHGHSLPCFCHAFSSYQHQNSNCY